MLEKRLAAVAPQLFTANGDANGNIIIATDACLLFKVKQKVFVAATGQPLLNLEIKEISNGTIQVGPIGNAGLPAGANGPPSKQAVPKSILLRTNLTSYTVASGANIFADEQGRPKIDFGEAQRAMFEEEPAVAMRSILVDDCGDKYNSTNPLPVAFDGTISIGEVEIKGSPSGVLLDVNSDGSINVNVVNSTPTSTPGVSVFYQEVSSVASGATTPIITFTTLSPGFRMFKIDVSGDNFATYTVLLNGVTIFTKRTWYGEFNETFSFEDFTNGLKLNTGDVVVVNVLHNRPFTGNFEATIMGISL
jgi:hypothetical protein